jgi:hypothetical protein
MSNFIGRDFIIEAVTNHFMNLGYLLQADDNIKDTIYAKNESSTDLAIKYYTYDSSFAKSKKLPPISNQTISAQLHATKSSYGDNHKTVYVVKDRIFDKSGFGYIINNDIDLYFVNQDGTLKKYTKKQDAPKVESSTNKTPSYTPKGLSTNKSANKKFKTAESLTKTKVDVQVIYKYFQDHGYLDENFDLTHKGSSWGFSIGTRGNNQKFLEIPDKFELYGYSNWILKQNSKKKAAGDQYEIFIGNMLESHGYIVKYHGFEKGKEDHSIDLIAIAPQEIILIQCKNWSLEKCKDDNRYLGEKDFQSFLNYCDEYVKKNHHQYSHYPKIQKLFIMSNKTIYKKDETFADHIEDFDIEIIPMA